MLAGSQQTLARLDLSIESDADWSNDSAVRDHLDFPVPLGVALEGRIVRGQLGKLDFGHDESMNANSIVRFLFGLCKPAWL